MEAADGKMWFTDVADTEQLLRLIQSIPSPKAEPFKTWLAKTGYQRIEVRKELTDEWEKRFIRDFRSLKNFGSLGQQGLQFY